MPIGYGTPHLYVYLNPLEKNMQPEHAAKILTKLNRKLLRQQDAVECTKEEIAIYEQAAKGVMRNPGEPK